MSIIEVFESFLGDNILSIFIKSLEKSDGRHHEFFAKVAFDFSQLLAISIHIWMMLSSEKLSKTSMMTIHSTRFRRILFWSISTILLFWVRKEFQILSNSEG